MSCSLVKCYTNQNENLLLYSIQFKIVLNIKTLDAYN